MRRGFYFGLCALLAIVSISAPFAHTHEAGKAKKHLAREHFSVLHSHIPLPRRDAALSEADNSVRRVNWYRFQHEDPVALAEPVEVSSLEAPVLDATSQIEPVESDPFPDESPPRAISPRGPPSLFA